jgi:predicted secreted protein
MSAIERERDSDIMNAKATKNGSHLLEFSLLLLLLVYLPPRLQSKSQTLYVVARETDNGSTLTIRRSQILLLDLPEQVSTGYSWSVDNLDTTMWRLHDLSDDDDAIKRLRDDRIIAQREAPQGRFGAIKSRVFRLEAKKAGRSTIDVNEARPWEPEKPKTHYVLHIIITK